MWWVPLIMAAKGAMDAKSAGDKQESYNKGQAEVTRYSPLTGQSGQLDNTNLPSATSGAIAGGIQGMAVQQGLESGGTADASGAGVAGQTGGVDMKTGAGALGGQQMSNQMGQDYSQPVAGQQSAFGNFNQPVDYSKLQLSQQPNYFASK